MTAQQIQQKRLQLGLLETQLAEKFGIDIKTLQLWESGLVSPPLRWAPTLYTQMGNFKMISTYDIL